MKRIAIGVCALVALVGCSSRESSENQNQPDVSIPQKMAAMNPEMNAKPSATQNPNQKAMIQQAVQYLNQRDANKAIAVLSKAASENPNDPQVFQILGDVYLHLNNLEGAVKSFERVVHLQPANGEVFYLLGICYGLSGDRNTAQKALERSIVIFQKNKDEGNFKKSVATLQQMMAADGEGISAVAKNRQQQIKLPVQ